MISSPRRSGSLLILSMGSNGTSLDSKRRRLPLSVLLPLMQSWCEMSKKLIVKGEWVKHLRPYGKRAANKKLRKIFKVSLKKHAAYA